MESKKYKCYYKESIKNVIALSFLDLKSKIREKYESLPGFNAQSFFLQVEDEEGWVDADTQSDFDFALTNKVKIICLEQNDQHDVQAQVLQQNEDQDIQNENEYEEYNYGDEEEEGEEEENEQ